MRIVANKDTWCIRIFPECVIFRYINWNGSEKIIKYYSSNNIYPDEIKI